LIIVSINFHSSKFITKKRTNVIDDTKGKGLKAPVKGESQ